MELTWNKSEILVILVSELTKRLSTEEFKEITEYLADENYKRLTKGEQKELKEMSWEKFETNKAAAILAYLVVKD